MTRATLLLACAVLASANTGHTQTSEPLNELTLEELMNLEVISSTQTPVSLQEAPSTISAVTGDQIRRWGIRRLSELVERLIPGAFAVEDGDDLILAFRGITSDSNPKVLLLLNGHYYNTQWNNGPSSEVELGLMDDIARVEVINGPGAALYGSGAVIAVLNIITKSGEDFQGVQASGTYGSGDYKKGELIAGDRITDDLDYFVSAGGITADGYDNGDLPINIARFPPGYRFYGDVRYKNFELMTRFARSSRALYNFPFQENGPRPYQNHDTFFIDARRDFEFSDKFRSSFIPKSKSYRCVCIVS